MKHEGVHIINDAEDDADNACDDAVDPCYDAFDPCDDAVDDCDDAVDAYDDGEEGRFCVCPRRRYTGYALHWHQGQNSAALHTLSDFSDIFRTTSSTMIRIFNSFSISPAHVQAYLSKFLPSTALCMCYVQNPAKCKIPLHCAMYNTSTYKS